MVKYEVGQIVEIRDNTCGHCFEIGEHVRIKSLDEDSEVETAEHLDGSDFWYLDADDFATIKGVLQ
jgi:hypothetical protein